MQFIDLKTQYNHLKDEINQNIQNVLDSGQYMMGDYVVQLEEELATYVGTEYCLTCANGTDALQLALMALNIGLGDAVFVPSFTFYSTAEVVSLLGATPIFVDIDSKTFNIDGEKLEKAIKKVKESNELFPKVIISVDLFGQPADYNLIKSIAEKYNLFLIEDGAQGFGGEINGNKACSFGDISTTSFFPAKPLGCYGDGGAIFTDNKQFYEILSSLRIHGKGTFKYDNVRVGMNSRLDTIQAGILLPKLHAFEKYELDIRNKVATLYSKELLNVVTTPFIKDGYLSSWAQYTILLQSEIERDDLKSKLSEKGIPSMIYYPKPLHKQPVYSEYQEVIMDLNISEDISKLCLSLPMHPYLDTKTIKFICDNIKAILQEIRQ